MRNWAVSVDGEALRTIAKVLQPSAKLCHAWLLLAFRAARGTSRGCVHSVGPGSGRAKAGRAGRPCRRAAADRWTRRAFIAGVRVRVGRGPWQVVVGNQAQANGMHSRLSRWCATEPE